jgi:hypothetical protein
MHVVVIVQRNSELMEIVAARHAPAGFASRLDRGQQERYEDANDGDDHQ